MGSMLWIHGKRVSIPLLHPHCWNEPILQRDPERLFFRTPGLTLPFSSG